jgi:hypothetical protein
MVCSQLRKFVRAHRRIADALEAIAAPRTRRIVFQIGPVSEQTKPIVLTPFAKRSAKGKVLAMLKLTTTQKCTLSVAFEDKKGNPANVDGAPTWGVDNSDLLSLIVSDDGLSCQIAAVGPMGTALVSVLADADLGEGVVQLAGTLEVQVTAGAATVVEVTAGEPSEQE